MASRVVPAMVLAVASRRQAPAAAERSPVPGPRRARTAPLPSSLRDWAPRAPRLLAVKVGRRKAEVRRESAAGRPAPTWAVRRSEAAGSPQRRGPAARAMQAETWTALQPREQRAPMQAGQAPRVAR